MRRKIWIEKRTGLRVILVHQDAKKRCLVEEEGGLNLHEVHITELTPTAMFEESVPPVKEAVLSPWEERKARRAAERNDEYAYDYDNGFYNYYR